MLTSLALIFIVGLAMGAICRQLKLPRIIGMLITGIVSRAIRFKSSRFLYIGDFSGLEKNGVNNYFVKGRIIP